MPVSDEIIDIVLIEGCILFCELFISSVLKSNSDIYVQFRQFIEFIEAKLNCLLKFRSLNNVFTIA